MINLYALAYAVLLAGNHGPPQSLIFLGSLLFTAIRAKWGDVVAGLYASIIDHDSLIHH